MFTCSVCFHVFANNQSLERHMKRHSTDKPYNCSTCGKSFARKEHLENHTRWAILIISRILILFELSLHSFVISFQDL